MPVDQYTYDQFKLAEKRAKELGLPLIEVLDRAGLLLTVKRRHDLQVESAEEVIRRLSRQNPNKLMSYYYQRVEGTSAEMFEAMRQWFEVVVRNFANNTLEEL